VICSIISPLKSIIHDDSFDPQFKFVNAQIFEQQQMKLT